VKRHNGKEEIVEKLPIDVKGGEKLFFKTADQSK